MKGSLLLAAAFLAVSTAYAQLEPVLPSPITEELPMSGEPRPEMDPLPLAPELEPDYLPEPDSPDCQLQAPRPGLPPPASTHASGATADLPDSQDRWYRNGKMALERHQWEDAVGWFQKLVDQRASRADAALYWKVYALHKLNRRAEALASVEDLKRNFPESRWLDDAKALEIEMRLASGQETPPEQERNENLKLLAVNGIIHSHPERAVRVVEELLQRGSSPPLKERALFVLAQSNSPQAGAMLLRVARSAANPDLQYKAVEYVGYQPSPEALRTLHQLFEGTGDDQLKRAVVRGYTAARERQRLVTVARADQNATVRREAIRGLGSLGAEGDLWQLYQTESAPDPRAEIIRVIPIRRDNATRFIDAAKTEQEPRTRRELIQQLGAIRLSSTTEALLRIYATAQDTSLRETVLESLHSQNNAQALVAIARSENNNTLKQTAVRLLSRMKSKEAADFLVEASSK